jgi:predicted NBD/HSP70 family sugar kinase
LKSIGIRTFEYSFAMGPTKLLNALGRDIRSLCTEAHVPPAKLLAMAVAVPGPVEAQEHPIFRPHPASGWRGFDIAAYLEEAFCKPVFIDNDANISTLGELLHWRRNGWSSGGENWLVVKMNASGIGAGIVSNGLLHRGATGLAGEIGHIEVKADGPRCACGLRGCLDSVASAPALLESARVNPIDRGNSRMRSQGSEQTVALRDLELAAQSRAEFANSLLLEAGTRVGSVVASAVSILNPAKVLVGGRFARMAPVILASIRQSIYGGALPLATHAIDVDYLKNKEAETHGALAYAFEKFLDTKCRIRSVRPVLSPLS